MTEPLEPWAVAVEGDSPPLVIEHLQEYAVTVEPAPDVLVVTVGEQGPPGIQGIPGPAGGTALQQVAGELIVGHRAVVLLDDSVFMYRPEDPLHPDLYYGVSLNSAALGDPVVVQRGGEIVETAWSFSPGVVLATASGLLVQTETPGEPLLIIGFASSATRLVLDTRTPIFP